jgi:tetratricopeptide (TPR) repeat protein
MNTLKSFCDQINALLLQNKLDDAESVANEAKALFPDEFPILERCAHVTHRKGMLFEAEKNYRNILERFSEKIPAWVGLINVLLLQNKLDDAESVANEAKALFPDEFPILERCAHCHFKIKKFTDSLRIYKSIEKRLASPKQCRDFASVLYELGEHDESRKVYQLALKRFKKSQLLINCYSNFLLNTGDYQSLMELIDEELLSVCSKTALFMGNCQAPPLSNILNMHRPFSSEYTTIRALPPIHRMPIGLQKIVADYLLPKIDLFVTQNILNSNSPLQTNVVKNIAKSTIVFPTFHFAGYFPDIIYLKKDGQTIRSSPLTDYHSALVLVSFFDGVSPQACSKQLISGDWIEKGYETYISSLFGTLHDREKFWDIKITNYLYNNFRSGILFHTVNHPNACLLHTTANLILNKLKKDRLPQSIIKETSDSLSQTRWIISDKIINNLSLEQNGRNFFIINKEKMSVSDFVSEHYQYYENNQSIVESNIEPCRDALFGWQK